MEKDNQMFLDELVRKNCYKFLKTPVIVTAGTSLTPFFLNGENVIGNDAFEYKNHEMNPYTMMMWSKEKLKKSNDFRKVMEIVKDSYDFTDIDIISGGRTRDWPFSSALASMLEKPALFLYKPQDNSSPVLITSNGDITAPKNINGKKVFHIVDLVTTASSVLNKGGWIDQIRSLKGEIKNVYSIIDRNQGACDSLLLRYVTLNSGVQINKEWLNKYDSENTTEVLNYLQNPQKWSIDYLLTKNGFEALIPYLDGNSNFAKKDNRLLKFVASNYVALKKTNLLEQIIENSKNFRAVEDISKGISKNERFLSALHKYNIDKPINNCIIYSKD